MKLSQYFKSMQYMFINVLHINSCGPTNDYLNRDEPKYFKRSEESIKYCELSLLTLDQVIGNF